MNYEIKQTKHTKTDADLWVVKFIDNIERSQWRAHVSRVKTLGGSNYSKFSGGFNFYFDPTEAMANEFGEAASNTQSTNGSTSKGYAIEVDIESDDIPNIEETSETYYTPNILQTFINDHARNQEIEKFLDYIVSNNIQPNDEEREFLSKYSGSGGMQKHGAEGKGIMTEYFTPDEVVRKMWDLAYMHGFEEGGRIMENSVGTGRFLQYAPANSQVDAFEINRYSYLITKILYPEANVRNIPFEQNFVDGSNLSIKDKVEPIYDLVIGNPPYGAFNSEYSATEKKHTRAANLTEYFITRSLDQLKSGGLLVYIIGAAIENGGIPFLSSGKTQCKELIEQKAKLIDAYRLGNKLFKHTSVLADIVVFQKR